MHALLAASRRVSPRLAVALVWLLVPLAAGATISASPTTSYDGSYTGRAPTESSRHAR